MRYRQRKNQHNMQIIKTGIIGGAGYTGGELIRLLLQHPQAQISFVHSRSNAGKAISDVHSDLIGETDLCFTDTLTEDIDVLFLCLGHGESRTFLETNLLTEHIRIIDLANDFRLQEQSVCGNRKFIYGLPELQRTAIRQAQHIANPGCFATAIQLGLLPLAAKGHLTEAYITGITGSTGAGQSLSNTAHFSWRANNIQAYKTLTHQHLGEIGQTLAGLQAGYDQRDLHFVPWRGDFPRGIFVSTQVKTNQDIDTLYEWYEDYYQEQPFVQISRKPVHLKQVVNTNKCVLQLELEDNHLVIHTAIDNLLKGAVGQAVQNMNLMMGLPETTGLYLKPLAF